MPEVTKTVTKPVEPVKTVKTVETPAVKPAKVVETVGPMDDADAAEAIMAVLNEWAAQNQGVAKADLQLGAFRTILQTARMPAE